MRTAILISRTDLAGMSIHAALQEMGPPSRASIHLIDESIVRCERIDERIDADRFIFASKHAAKSGIPSLTVHAPGNFNEAQFGGAPGRLCIAAEGMLKTGFKAIDALKPEGYEAIIEATHHGPLIEKPCLFIELGSDERGWSNAEGAKAIAHAIHQILSEEPAAHRTAIALGGPHHGPRFLKTLLESDIAISHLCPKHQLQTLDEAMLQQMIERSVQPATLALLDWKGLGQEKERIARLCADAGLEMMKIK